MAVRETGRIGRLVAFSRGFARQMEFIVNSDVVRL